jgi:hypothetical protein
MALNRFQPFAAFRRSTSMNALAPLIVMVGSLLAPRLAGAQVGEGAVPAAVASVLDEQTVAVVGIDTTRVDLDALVSQISAIPVVTERQRGDLAIYKKQLAQWVEQFHKAGGHDIWIVLTLADGIADMPFVVVPLNQGADRQGLEALFVAGKLAVPHGMDYPFVVTNALERNNGLVLGSKDTLDRLKKLSAPQRVIPQEALKAVAGAEVRVFLLPTDDQRRVLSEFLRDPQAERTIVEHMPQGTVPPEFLRDPAEVARLALTDGLQWIAAGITTRDPMSLKLVVGSKDATSAKALALWMAGAWQFAKQNVAAEKTAESTMIAALIDQFSRLLTPKIEGDRLTIQVDMKQLTASTAGAFLGEAAFGAAKRAESTVVKNHLKQLALAMHNYHDVYKQFPPAAIRDEQGRPLLSWRVSLLPFLDANELYKQFHLDEPWDSQHNKPLIAKMPEVFAPRGAQLRSQGKTTFVVPVGKQTIFGPPEGVPIRDITDGTSNTILIIDTDESRAVTWTKPDDLNVDGVDVKRVLFGNRKDGAFCAFADGSVQRIDPKLSTEVLHALLTRNGGEAIPRP